MTGAEVRRFGLFQRLSEHDAEDLGSRITTHRADRGMALFHQGEPAHHLVLLPEGQVKMERVSPDGTATIVEVLGPGSVLAAANFLSQEPYPVTSVALVDLAYAALNYQDFAACVRHHPDVALSLLQYLAVRLHRAYGSRRAVARSHVRLADALLRVAADSPVDSDGTRVVGLSHGDLAELAGMARETVTRHLQTWQAQGLVDLGLRSIRVLDLGALRNLVNDGEGAFPPHHGGESSRDGDARSDA